MKRHQRPAIPLEKQRFRVSNQAEARRSLEYFRAMNSINSARQSPSNSVASGSKLRRVSDG